MPPLPPPGYTPGAEVTCNSVLALKRKILISSAQLTPHRTNKPLLAFSDTTASVLQNTVVPAVSSLNTAHPILA